jgi:hypothetical protein
LIVHRNAISFAAVGFHGKLLPFLLASGVPIQDTEDLHGLFDRDDFFLRFAIFATYSDHPQNLLRKAAELNRPVLNSFLKTYTSCSFPYPEASCLAVLDASTPDWSREMEEITENLEAVRFEVDGLLAADLDDRDGLYDKGSLVTAGINNFITKYRRCRVGMNEKQETFADFEPFLQEAESKMARSVRFANGEDPDFLADLWQTFDKSPFLHCVLAIRHQDDLPRFLRFADQFAQVIARKRSEAPDFKGFLNEKRQEVKELGLRLATGFFDRLNTFYNAVQIRTAGDFLKGSLADFVSEMIGEVIAPRLQKVDAVVHDLLQAINSLRMLCRSMGLPLPTIDASRSGYVPSEEEILMGQFRTQLKETQALEEKILEMNRAMSELRQFSSICTECRQYCSSWICPHCHVFLYCVLCKRTNVVCPACAALFGEPLLINKTSFFGDEFTMQMRREYDERMRGQAARDSSLSKDA